MRVDPPKSESLSVVRSCEFLNQAFQQKVKLNPSYSLRAAARDLGVTAGYLSVIFNGKKKLTFQRAVQFAQFLKMEETQTELFLKAVALESMKDKAFRSFLQNSWSSSENSQTNEYAMLEIDRFRTLSEWYHIAILDLTRIKGFQSDFEWVAVELGITTDQVKSAVARLERLGLLEIVRGRWIKTSAKLVVPTNHSDRAIREFHDQMIEKAREALQSPSQEDFATREISGITFVVNPDRMPEAKTKIDRFKREMLEFMGDGECSALYQMNVQFFQLNKSRGVNRAAKKGAIK